MKNHFAAMTVIFLLLALFSPSASAADPAPENIVIGTWNIEWFFDHDQSDNESALAKKLSAPTQKDWDWRVTETAKVIAAINPTVLALQEIENEKVVQELTKQLRDGHDQNYKVAFIQGRDTYTEQDVALIYKSGLIHKERRNQTDEMYESKHYYNLSKHLFATFQWTHQGNTHEITLCNVHLRAGTRGEEPRLRQCRLINYWIQPHIKKQENIIVLGDINTLCECHEYALDQDLAVLCGKKGSDQVGDLIDLHTKLKESERATHMIGTQFDHILVSPELLKDSREQSDLSFHSIERRKDLVLRGKQDEDHYNIFYQIEESERDISDHYPVIATFKIK
ncbi:MAG: hypothetical protein CMJ76_16140 [Planctomycetaceae bacterium]|nr:hypothetical protein [Planctomycetaceae bacterium]